LYNPQLETFITVAESGSFAKAADINHPHSIKNSAGTHRPALLLCSPSAPKGCFL
jgi:hypothetical protein